MNNLSNDTYIQRTNKGDLALIAKPPIDIKLRHYLHEIPVLNEINIKEDLVNLSQLYINVNEKNPYEFRRIVDDILKKGWIMPISEEVLLSLFGNKKESASEVIEENEEIIIENSNEEVIIIEEIVDSIPEKKEKELSEWLLEEKLKKEAEELKKEEIIEEEIPEIPWDNPYTSLEDFLSDGKKESKIKIKKEEIDFKEDYHNSWTDEQQDDSSSYSKTKSEKLQEQLTLMKKDKKRKTGSSITNEKTSSEDNKKNKGFFGRVGSIFKKGE